VTTSRLNFYSRGTLRIDPMASNIWLTVSRYRGNGLSTCCSRRTFRRAAVSAFGDANNHANPIVIGIMKMYRAFITYGSVLDTTLEYRRAVPRYAVGILNRVWEH
jgi:hypothetical protein